MPSEETKTPKSFPKKRCDILEQSVFTESIESKHYRKMRSAIWLILYLAKKADRKTGELRTNLEAISSDMGIPRITIQRWLKILRSGGYVQTGRTGRLLAIRIRFNNDTLGSSRMMHQTPQKWNIKHIKNDAVHNQGNCLKTANLKQNMTTHKKNQKASPIESINNKLNIDIDRENPLSQPSDSRFSNGQRPESKEELLALDLATGLDDIKGLPLYISYVRKYPEHLLRRILGVVKEIPSEKVKRSRGALFNYLVQKHGHQNKNNPRD